MKQSSGSVSKFIIILAACLLPCFIAYSSRTSGCATIDSIKRGQDIQSILASASSDILGAGEEDYSQVSLSLPVHQAYGAYTGRHSYTSLTTEKQREAYLAVEQAAFRITESESERGGYLTARAPVGSLDSMEVFSVIEGVIADHPEIFWLDGNYYIGRNMRDGSYVVLNSTLSYDEIYVRARLLENAVADALSRIPGELDEYSRELRIHDIIVSDTIYDTETADAGVIFSDSSTAYGSLVKKLAVCSGYSKAFKLLCNLSGIACETVKGLSYDGSGHMWNVCRVLGDWYYVDSTWDDTFDGQAVNVVFYDYFNITESQLAFNHETAAVFPSISHGSENKDNLYNFPVPKVSESPLGNYERCAAHISALDDSNAKLIREKMTEALLSDRYFFVEFDESIDSANADSWMGRNWGRVRRSSSDPDADVIALYRVKRTEVSPPYCRDVFCMIMAPQDNISTEEDEAA